MLQRIVNFLALQAGWFACVLGAAHGRPLIGPLVVAALLAWHLARAPEPLGEIRLIAAAGVLGFAADTFLLAAGSFSFSEGQIFGAALPPPWLTCLWLLFATTLNSSLSWLSGRYLLGAILGAVAGPASYYAGARMGAATLGAHVAGGLAVIGAVWAGAMPALLWLAKRKAAGNPPRV